MDVFHCRAYFDEPAAINTDHPGGSVWTDTRKMAAGNPHRQFNRASLRNRQIATANNPALDRSVLPDHTDPRRDQHHVIAVTTTTWRPIGRYRRGITSFSNSCCDHAPAFVNRLYGTQRHQDLETDDVIQSETISTLVHSVGTPAQVALADSSLTGSAVDTNDWDAAF